jgi:DNA-binding response OmpR family regulator
MVTCAGVPLTSIMLRAMTETILLIERAGKKENTFADALERKGYAVEIASAGIDALKRAIRVQPALIVLNAASLGSSGVRICKNLREGISNVPIIHIMPSDVSEADIKVVAAEIVLVMPFTARKLINRIKRLMPGARTDAIEVGPIKLVTSVRIVEAHGKEKRLTPKSADLLQVFLNHPGDTLDRSFLMRQVWDTDYIGDTRTLDVHVRWVREAIEADPTSPAHIVTVRGKGYRFDPYPIAGPHNGR